MSDWDHFDEDILDFIESQDAVDPDELQDFALNSDPYTYEDADEFYERFSDETQYDEKGY